MKKIQFQIVAFVLVMVFQISEAQPASSPDWAKVHTMTMDGINALYNFKFNQAEAKFNEVIQTVPQDPRGYFFKAMISYYRFEFMRNESDYDRFMKLSDSVIAVAEEIIDNDDKNSNALFFLGGMYGYRGMVRSENDELLQAALDGKKGYGYLQDALEINPKNYDAQMGLGLFNYYLSKLPGAFQWIAKVIGFSPDGKMGLTLLERTATKGMYARNEARWWLSQFYQWEGETEKGIHYLKELSESYPDNPFYVQRYGYALLFSLNRVDEAIPIFQKAVSMTNREAERYITQGYHRLGHCYRFKNQFGNAIEYYKKFISSITVDTAQQRFAHFCIGLCYEMMGDRPSALPYYQNAPSHASKRLRKPMTIYDIELEKMSNCFSAGYNREGIELGSTLLAMKDLSDDQRGEVLMNIGDTYFKQKDYTNAATHYIQVTALSIKQELWVPPNAHYMLGLCYLRNGQIGIAKQEFEKVLEFEEYDGEDDLRESAEEQLNGIED